MIGHVRSHIGQPNFAEGNGDVRSIATRRSGTIICRPTSLQYRHIATDQQFCDANDHNGPSLQPGTNDVAVLGTGARACAMIKFVVLINSVPVQMNVSVPANDKFNARSLGWQ